MENSHDAYATCVTINGTQECTTSPPVLISIKSNMLNYVNSDKPVFTITGVPYSLAYLEIDDSSGNIVSSHRIDILPTGIANYTLDISTYKSDVYSATASTSVSKVSTSFSVGLMPAGRYMIMLDLNKDMYVPGDSIVILGAYQPNAIYQISLLDPNGTVVNSIQAVSNETGHFSSSDLKIPANAISGTWKIITSSGQTHNTRYITVISQNLKENTNNVEIQNIQVQPSTIKVGDAFTVTTTLFNNSTFPIILDGGTCSINDIKHVPFFTVTFDNHAKIKEKNINCAGVGVSQILNPEKNIVGTSPDFTATYIATESGTANVTVTFSYDVKNQTDPAQPNPRQTISKSFLFTILDNNTGTKTVTEAALSPLKQFKSGISTYDIKCSDGYTLTIKSEDGHPACVKPGSVARLLQQGWMLEPYVNWSKK